MSNIEQNEIKRNNKVIIKIEYPNNCIFLNKVDLRTVNNIFYISCLIRVGSRIMRFSKLKHPSNQLCKILKFLYSIIDKDDITKYSNIFKTYNKIKYFYPNRVEYVLDFVSKKKMIEEIINLTNKLGLNISLDVWFGKGKDKSFIYFNKIYY